jgi:hypothetical protein
MCVSCLLKLFALSMRIMFNLFNFDNFFKFQKKFPNDESRKKKTFSICEKYFFIFFSTKTATNVTKKCKLPFYCRDQFMTFSPLAPSFVYMLFLIFYFFVCVHTLNHSLTHAFSLKESIVI